jgi:hypothetical protein
MNSQKKSTNRFSRLFCALLDGETEAHALVPPNGISFDLQPKPVVRDRVTVVRPCFEFLTNFDRRVMVATAKFFKRVCELIEPGSQGPAPCNVNAGMAQRGGPIENQREGA